jgi:amino acid adenylation domain-containing protein
LSSKDKSLYSKKKVSSLKLRRVLKSIDTTASQKEMWSTINFTESANSAYNLTLKIELNGKIDIRALKLAFNDLCLRYTILNCIFSKDGEKMLFLDDLSPSLEIFNLDLYDVADFGKNEVSKPFDLSRGPLVRTSLLKGSTSSILFFTVHHIICDGWSLEIVIQDLSRLYSQRVTGAVLLDPSPLQFYNYTQKRNFNSIKEYWRVKLESFKNEFCLPCEYTRPNQRTFESKRLDIVFSKNLSKDFKKLSLKNGSSFFSGLLSVYALLLHKITGADDLIIGIPAAEQPTSGHNNLVGHYVNLLPVRIKLSDSDDFINLLGKVRSSFMDDLDHQQVTFGELLQVIDVPRAPGKIPLVNNIFNLDIQKKNQGLDFIGLESSFRTVARNSENFELFLNIVAFGDELIFEMQYNTNLFSEKLITSWISSFEKLVAIIINNPNLPLKSILLDLPVIDTKLNTDVSPINRSVVAIEPSLPQNLKVNNKVDIKHLWVELLLLDDIPMNMNFFALGGHSLLAIKMVSRLKEIGYQVGLNDIFSYPTLGELNQFLGLQNPIEEVDKINIVHNVKESHGLGSSQMRSLFLSLKTNIAINNLPTALNLGLGIDLDHLKQALAHFLKCHPILLSKLYVDNNGDYEFKGPFPYNIEVVVEHKTNEQIIEFVESQFTKKMDLMNEFLFKTQIFINEKSETVLFFMPNHIVWDGWCFDLLINELNSNYICINRGERPKVSEEKYTYSDFIDFSKSLLESRSYAKSLNYWHEKLSGKLPILDLPLDYKRPKDKSNLASSVFIDFDSTDVKNLHTVSTQLGVSTFNILLAVFNLVLSKYSRQDDIVVGLPVRNRQNEKFENTVGYFVNSIAIRSKLSSDMSMLDLIRMIARSCFEGFDNEQVFFEDVVKLLGIPPDTSRNPVFQSFFTFQEISNRSETFDNNKLTHVKRKINTTHADLDLWVKSSPEKIEGAFVYRLDLFKEVTIERIKESFELITKSILNLLNEKIVNIDVITQSQKTLLESTWNQTEKIYEKKSVSELFEDSVTKFADNKAIYCSKYEFSYQEASLKSDQFASKLINSGVKPGDLVGLCVDRDSYMLISILGVLKAGAGYIPLEPTFPKDRINYMIDSSDLSIIICNEKYQERFPTINCRITIEFLIDDLSEDISELPKVDLESLMYVIYTSGSTGLPKGVELTHRSITNFLQSMAINPGMNETTSLLAVTTLSFDIAVLEIFTPLLVGGSVFLASKEQTINGDSLKNIIENKKINTMQATPSTWRLLLSSSWEASKDFKILCGGEPFPKDLAKTLLSQTENVWNMYGPTETTVWSTCKKLNINDKKILIGKPINNTEVFILDELGRNVPIGATGEMYISGDGLALGYRKRQDLTDKVFIFNKRLNKKLYNTGDLARWSFDGELECLGRNDGQVKVRGYRIELGEIEAQISKDPNIDSCVVITREDIPGDVRLVAYIIGVFNHLELRKFLGKSLPIYMIPTNFIKMESFPKTLNDKIDRKALPSPQSLMRGSKDTSLKNIFVNPRNKTEEIVKSLWVSVLSKNDFGVEDDFFDIGGHSILSVTLFSKIESRFNIQLDLSMLFDYPTIALISEVIDKKINDKQSANISIQAIAKPNTSTCVVKIKDGDDGVPLFMFHGVGGNVLNYRELGLKVKKDKAVFGVQSQGVDGVSTLHSSITQMAKDYASEIYSICPGNKVILAGGSMGGLLALEVANELKIKGVEIEKLIMFDTSGPTIDYIHYTPVIQRFKILLDSLSYRISSYIKQKQISKIELKGGFIPHDLRYFRIEKNNFKCIREHIISKYAGDIILFRSPIKSKGYYSDPLLGWRGVVLGEIKTIIFDVDHQSFVESNLVQDSFIKELSKP